MYAKLQNLNPRLGIKFLLNFNKSSLISCEILNKNSASNGAGEMHILQKINLFIQYPCPYCVQILREETLLKAEKTIKSCTILVL